MNAKRTKILIALYNYHRNKLIDTGETYSLHYGKSCIYILLNSWVLFCNKSNPTNLLSKS